MQPAEEVLYKKGANLFRGIEGVGGWIHLYREKLLFKPHSFNIQSQYLHIPYSEIASVRKANLLLLLPNGVKLQLKSGKTHTFVVWGREKLVRMIRENIKKSAEMTNASQIG